VNEDSDQSSAAALDAGASLAYERTFLAHERTQMAWVRTALSLISFGFAIAKFFDTVRQNQGEGATPLSPHDVGILMIGIGLVALILGFLQHARAMKLLRSRCPTLPRSLAAVVSALLGALGCVALAGAIFR
jgi:putative membrane protein